MDSIAVSPDSRIVDQGTTTNFTAVATFENKATRNYTQRVTWESSAPSVASVSNEDGDRGRVTGLAPGTATITAIDPVSGVSSDDSRENGSVTVFGPLERLVVSPKTTTRTLDEPLRYTVTGYFAGGTQRNMTQRVLYFSNDLNVVVPLNQEGDRSLMEIVGPGKATISAVDPASGISSTLTNDDATVTVTIP